MYRSSGTVPTDGLLSLISATLVLSAFFGWVAYEISRYAFAWTFSKVGFLLYTVIGVTIGALLLKVGKLRKVRNQAVLILLVTIAAVLTVGTRLAIKGMEPIVRTAIAFSNAHSAPSSERTITAIHAKARAKIDPVTAAVDYVRWLSDGHLIVKGASGAITRRLTGFDFWFEFLFPPIGLLIGIVVVKMADSDQFCEKCDVWKQNTLFTQNSASNAAEITKLVALGGWQEAKDLPTNGTIDTSNNTKVTLSKCPSCSECSVLVKSTKRNRARSHYFGRVPDETSKYLATLP
jgi:hypothetical protein